MNLGQLQASVFRRLEEENVSGRWSQSDVNDAINEGLEELSDATEFYEQSSILKLRDEATYYDLRTALPSTVLRITAIYDSTTNRWLIPADVSDFDYYGVRQWELARGNPINFLVRGLWWLGLFPAIATGYSIRVQYRGIHPPLQYSTESPQQLPETYHSSLVDYAVYTLLADDNEASAAMRYWQRYKAAESELARKGSGGRLDVARRGGMGSPR